MPFAPCSAACAIFRTADGPIVHDAIIIGAGAAGLMCALVAGKRGFRCALVDHASQAGRKLRLAGGGRGNVTNRRVGPEWYVGEQPRFAEGALRRCPPSLVLDMLDAFKAGMERALGDGACHVLSIRPVGGVRLV